MFINVRTVWFSPLLFHVFPQSQPVLTLPSVSSSLLARTRRRVPTTNREAKPSLTRYRKPTFCRILSFADWVRLSCLDPKQIFADWSKQSNTSSIPLPHSDWLLPWFSRCQDNCQVFYIHNLPSSVTQNMLRKRFQVFGSTEDCKVIICNE